MQNIVQHMHPACHHPIPQQPRLATGAASSVRGPQEILQKARRTTCKSEQYTYKHTRHIAALRITVFRYIAVFRYIVVLRITVLRNIVVFRSIRLTHRRLTLYPTALCFKIHRVIYGAAFVTSCPCWPMPFSKVCPWLSYTSSILRVLFILHSI